MAVVFAFVLAVVPVVLAVPTVIVLTSAAVAFPVTVIKSLSIVARRYPARSRIDRAGPVSFMPSVMAFYRIPISVHPCIIRTWGSGPDLNHAGRRGRADSDSD